MSRMEGDALATVTNEELELTPAVRSDTLQVPALRSEILELQNRLADIEARRISFLNIPQREDGDSGDFQVLMGIKFLFFKTWHLNISSFTTPIY